MLELKRWSTATSLIVEWGHPSLVVTADEV
jgi:hypothetical protein